MAETREVHIGPLEFYVFGLMAERLDEYNWDDGIFSPEDLLGVTTDDPDEAEQQAIEIVARVADGAVDTGLEGRLKALINVADQADTLVQSVRRVAALQPRYWGNIGLGNGELEFTAASWQAAGGAEAMRGLRRELYDWQLIAAAGASTFLNDPQSSADRVYTGRVNMDVEGRLAATADNILYRVRVEIAEVRNFFHVGEASYRTYDFCQYASDLECEGKGCPKDDEVTGDFCVPTF